MHEILIWVILLILMFGLGFLLGWFQYKIKKKPFKDSEQEFINPYLLSGEEAKRTEVARKAGKIFTYLFAFTIILFLFGCEGKQGLPGEPGEDGNANVITILFNFNSSDLIIQGDIRVYRFSFDVQQFTSNDMAILLYISSQSVDWIQIPFNEPGWAVSIFYSFDAPTIKIDFRTDSGNAKTKFIQMFNGDTEYLGRIVLIPKSN